MASEAPKLVDVSDFSALAARLLAPLDDLQEAKLLTDLAPVFPDFSPSDIKHGMKLARDLHGYLTAREAKREVKTESAAPPKDDAKKDAKLETTTASEIGHKWLKKETREVGPAPNWLRATDYVCETCGIFFVHHYALADRDVEMKEALLPCTCPPAPEEEELYEARDAVRTDIPRTVTKEGEDGHSFRYLYSKWDGLTIHAPLMNHLFQCRKCCVYLRFLDRHDITVESSMLQQRVPRNCHPSRHVRRGIVIPTSDLRDGEMERGRSRGARRVGECEMDAIASHQL